MKFYPEFQLLKDTWYDSPREKGALIPTKRAFKLSQIGRYLPHTMLIETKSEHEIIYRVLGSGILRMVNREWQGENMLNHSPKTARKALIVHYQLMQKTPSFRFYQEILDFPSGKKIRSSSMAVPLLDNDGISRFLFCVVNFEAIGFENTLYPDTDFVTNSTLQHITYEDIGFGQQHKAAGWYIDGVQIDPTTEEGSKTLAGFSFAPANP